MTDTAPDALLLIAPGCPHCHTVLEGLNALVKDGAVRALEVVNIAEHPERAADLGVRSAPWLRLGEFIIEGAATPAELRRWAEAATRSDGVARYLEQQLADGHLPLVRQLVRAHPQWLDTLLDFAADPDSAMHLRLGVGALLEDLHGSEALRERLPRLVEMSTHADHRVRSDACHYLALTDDANALPALRARLDDDHAEVREIAAESIDALETPAAS